MRALSDDWCLEYIFHEPDGDARDSECFTHVATTTTQTGRYMVIGLDLDADIYQQHFRSATSIEMRLQGTSITDSLSRRELQKLEAFWAEVDRRSGDRRSEG